MVSGFIIICSNCGKVVNLTYDNRDNAEIILSVGNDGEEDVAYLKCSCGNSIENF